jgi:hypothetical protein
VVDVLVLVSSEVEEISLAPVNSTISALSRASQQQRGEGVQ